MRSTKNRQEMSLRCRELVDGNGSKRVVAALRGGKLRLRPAREDDSRLLWEWANDSQVRASSFSSDDIPWATHVAWFAKKLQQEKCCIFIAEDDEGTPIGQIRFDSRADGDFEIGVSLANAWRGQGLAVPLIQQATRSVVWGKHGARLHAFVKPKNVASVRAFENGGFRRVGLDQIKGHEAIHLIYEAD
jgi:RimJ/RimL family protein N-acetyltransferase